MRVSFNNKNKENGGTAPLVGKPTFYYSKILLFCLVNEAGPALLRPASKNNIKNGEGLSEKYIPSDQYNHNSRHMLRTFSRRF